MTVSGWGFTEEGNYSSSPTILREVDVPVISTAECVSHYGTVVSDDNLCAGFPEGGKDACEGDSGGPGVFFNTDNRAYHIGIVSFGNGCGRPNAPGVYCRTTKYLDWITENTGEKILQLIQFHSLKFLKISVFYIALHVG